jgi:hypothetical protein
LRREEDAAVVGMPVRDPPPLVLAALNAELDAAVLDAGADLAHDQFSPDPEIGGSLPKLLEAWRDDFDGNGLMDTVTELCH